ncbi:hypothetical protein ACFVUS_20410 [Nocardia sp. NPDC058058]
MLPGTVTGGSCRQVPSGFLVGDGVRVVDGSRYMGQDATTLVMACGAA